MHSFENSKIQRKFELFAIHALTESSKLHFSDEKRWNEFVSAAIEENVKIEKEIFIEIFKEWKWSTEIAEELYNKYLAAFQVKTRVNEVKEEIQSR